MFSLCHLWAVIQFILPPRSPGTSPGLQHSNSRLNLPHGCSPHFAKVLKSHPGLLPTLNTVFCLTLVLTPGTGLHWHPCHPAWFCRLCLMLGWLLCGYLEMPLAWVIRYPISSDIISNRAYAMTGMCCIPQKTRTTYKLITNKLDVLSMAFQLWYAISDYSIFLFIRECVYQFKWQERIFPMWVERVLQLNYSSYRKAYNV